MVFTVLTPAGLSGYLANPRLKENAAAFLAQAKEAIPDANYWKDKTVGKAKRMWFCFRNKSKCSKKEVVKSRTWIIGVPTAIAVALLTVAGLAVSKNQVEQAKKLTYDEEQFAQNLATFMQLRAANEQSILRPDVSLDQAVMLLHNGKFNDETNYIKKDIYDYALTIYNKRLAELPAGL